MQLTFNRLGHTTTYIKRKFDKDALTKSPDMVKRFAIEVSNRFESLTDTDLSDDVLGVGKKINHLSTANICRAYHRLQTTYQEILAVGGKGAYWLIFSIHFLNVFPVGKRPQYTDHYFSQYKKTAASHAQ